MTSRPSEVSERGTAGAPLKDAKAIIAARAARELRDGQIINLGIGLPTLIANYVPNGVDVIIQTENGAIGVGPAPEAGCEDRDRANAGNQPITLIPGGSYFDSATSFGMIRGGHVDATFLGTLQVDEEGNIANWIVPGKMLAGMGGAMDLVTGAKVVHIVTEHCSKDGASKLMKRCTFPLTGAGEADVIITERALFRRRPGEGWVLEEVAEGYTPDDIAAFTDMAYTVAEDVKLDAYGA
jgi:3-oxoacid CoA-transferase B subunit